MEEKEDFISIVALIKQSRNNAIKAVNSELINLYWNVGAYIHRQLANANWGEKTVDELANFIQKNYPELKGFNRSGLFRMKQFFESYAYTQIVASSRQLINTDGSKKEIVASSRRQLKNSDGTKAKKIPIEVADIRKTILVNLSWTHHRTIFSRCKNYEEREFYMQLCIKENYSVKDLERQINAAVFERMMIGKINLPKFKSTLPNGFENVFKDDYIFEFINLPEAYHENDLQKGLIKQMKNFILELGKDFLFIAEEYRLQVGNKDFYCDLLFFHRGLQCLVVFELKTIAFEPEHLGKLNFYLEALDRDVKKDNENPSIGILLCKDKDNEVVEYALSRNVSPTLIAQYHTILPDKKMLQNKLHELYDWLTIKTNGE
jgi:predicted nuclease of restriction endonuclease-like (RecB) superfamily